MAGRIMSDAEIKRRKKIQGAVSRTTGTLGLASLGAFTTARLGGKGTSALKAQKAIPALKRINPAVADKVALGTSTAGAGIGGASSFNFAAYTSAEGRKRQPVKKNVETTMDMGHYAEEGIAKNWEPTARNYSPEANRKRRAKAYEVGTAGAAGVAGGASLVRLAEGQAIASDGRAGRLKASQESRVKNPSVKAQRYLDGVAARKTAVKAKRVSAGKAGAAAVGLGAATAGIHSWRKKEFGKSSAFGIAHD
jgi:hypothetical protein